VTNVTRLNIPRGTRLETVWRVVDVYGQVNWQVFTACADRNAPFKQMQGTALWLNADGSASRHTEDGDVIDHFDVMPSLAEMDLKS